MLAWETVDRVRAPDGAELVLARRGGEWAVRAAGRVLMTSRAHASEEALAALALERVRAARAVLVGGLGLGFTLRAALDRLTDGAQVTVAELSPAVIGWNRGPVAPLAGRPLDDRRVKLVEADVATVAAGARWDAILLDVDNGPSPLAHAANARLYGEAGLAAFRAALRDGGVLAVWSAGADPAFLARLGRAGLDAEVRPVPAADGGGQRHAIFLGVKRGAGVTGRRGGGRGRSRRAVGSRSERG